MHLSAYPVGQVGVDLHPVRELLGDLQAALAYDVEVEAAGIHQGLALCDALEHAGIVAPATARAP